MILHRARRPTIDRCRFAPCRAPEPAPSCHRQTARRPGERACRWPRKGDRSGPPCCRPNPPSWSDPAQRRRVHRSALPVQRQRIGVFRDDHMRKRTSPRTPRSIGNDGSGACMIAAQARQLSFGRTCSTTLKNDGTYSSTSVTSSPILRSTVPLHDAQAGGASCSTRSRGA